MAIGIPQLSIGKQRIQFCSPGTGTNATTDPIFPGRHPKAFDHVPVVSTIRESRSDVLDHDGDPDFERFGSSRFVDVFRADHGHRPCD
jgi:hypothetical protein